MQVFATSIRLGVCWSSDHIIQRDRAHISNLTRVLGDTWYSSFRLAPSPSNQSASTLFKKLSKRITSLDTGADASTATATQHLYFAAVFSSV